MTDVLGFDRHAAGQQLMILGLAFATGSLSTGIIADKVQRRGISTNVVLATAFALFATAQLAMIFALPIPLPLIWIVYGFTGQAANLGYATLGAHFGRDLAGRAQSGANLLLFLASAFFQSSIGWVLDHLSADFALAQADNYAIAFGTLLILQVAAFVWYITGRYAIPQRSAPMR
jgi:MFS family permease